MKQNIYAFTVPGVCGKKSKVEVRNKMFLWLYETFLRLLLSKYVCIQRQHGIDLSISGPRSKIEFIFYISLFSVCIIKKLGFLIFHTE